MDKTSDEEISEEETEDILGKTTSLTEVEVGQGKAILRYFRRNEKIRIKNHHFAKDCPNIKTADSFQPKQMQQLMNTEEVDRSLQPFTDETYNS